MLDDSFLCIKSHQIIVFIIPCKRPRTYYERPAFIARNKFLFYVPLEVYEADFPVRQNRFLNLIHIVVDTFVRCLDSVGYVNVMLQLLRFIDAGKALQLSDQFSGFFLCDELGRLNTIHKELYKILWNQVGMARNAEGLKSALKKLKEVREQFDTCVRIPGSKEGLNVELDKAIHLRDFILMGELIAYDALERNESCGGHFREESQTEEGEAKRNDEEFMYVACWEYQKDDDTAPVLHKEPLNYEYIKVQTRNYKS